MTTLPPPGEPDIYEALLNAMVQASGTMRTANAAYAAALQPMRQAMERIGRHTAMLEQVVELSDRAYAISREALAMPILDSPERMRPAVELFGQAADLHREAAATAWEIHFSMLQASPLLMQGIEMMLAASEEHRIGLERATTLLLQVRRHQTNGGTPDAQAA